MSIQTLIEEALREMHPGGILICGHTTAGNKEIPWDEGDMPVMVKFANRVLEEARAIAIKHSTSMANAKAMANAISLIKVKI